MSLGERAALEGVLASLQPVAGDRDRHRRGRQPAPDRRPQRRGPLVRPRRARRRDGEDRPCHLPLGGQPCAATGVPRRARRRRAQRRLRPRRRRPLDRGRQGGRRGPALLAGDRADDDPPPRHRQRGRPRRDRRRRPRPPIARSSTRTSTSSPATCFARSRFATRSGAGSGSSSSTSASDQPRRRAGPRQQRIYETASILREHRDGRVPLAARLRVRASPRARRAGRVSAAGRRGSPSSPARSGRSAAAGSAPTSRPRPKRWRRSPTSPCSRRLRHRADYERLGRRAIRRSPTPSSCSSREPRAWDIGETDAALSLWSSRAFEALCERYPGGGPDLVEFPDYLGEGFVTDAGAAVRRPRGSPTRRSAFARTRPAS